MAIFNGAPPAFQSTQNAGTSVGTAAAGVQVYNAGSATVINTAGTTVYAFATGVILSNLTLVNTGTAIAYMGGGTAGTVTAASGIPLAPGQQMTIQGSSALGATNNTTVGTGGITFNIWAITTAGTTNIEASLATVVAVD